MSGPLVQQHCQHYEHGSHMCPDPDLGHQSPQYDTPRASASGHESRVSLIVAALVTILGLTIKL